MLENTGWESTGYNLLNACSWQGKPPNMQMCWPGTCSSKEQLLTVLTWQYFHLESDSCIRQTSEVECSNMGVKSYHLLRSLLRRHDIGCSPKMFATPREMSAALPDVDDAFEHPSSEELPSWEKLPQRFWAWPEVAISQTLTDRLAASEPKHCASLTVYSGGTVAGFLDKMGYLNELGVDGIVLSPMVEQMPNAYHG